MAGSFIPILQMGKLKHMYLCKQLAPGSQRRVTEPDWSGILVT